MAFLEDVIADLDAYQAAHPWRRRFWHAWRTVRHAPGDARNQVRWAWQRVFRGWDDRALWSLDTWLARTLGAQLVAMAALAHGWPIPHDEFLPRGSFDPTEVAQADLHWVADHLPNLWD